MPINTTTYDKNDWKFRGGLGWMLEDDIIWHNGGTPGFSSFLGFNKERSLGVVVLSNYRSSLFTINPEQIGKEVLQFMKEGE